jgi:hypothetical protein
MYNVGFGDCFLLTFHYAKSAARHMLVDYGSTAAPRNGPKNYMERVAQDIAAQCKGKLDVVVATHRHRDHISGFSTAAGTSKVIAALRPDHVIQPWTEDPEAKTNATTATASAYPGGKPDPQEMTAHFLGSLDDMRRVADHAVRFSKSTKAAGPEIREQLRFIGENNLTNLSAVKNLMDMGKRGHAYYVHAGMELNSLLPGVKITVLGPPTLQQSDSIRKKRSQDANEFWLFRNFWGSQGRAMANFGGARLQPVDVPPPSVRWFLRKSREIHAHQMLELVRDLDSVINNTSVILLFEIGKIKLLFPGDAQIENWSFALHNAKWRKLLADVNLYKVGHHGSLNATPKSLWALFKHKGDAHRHDRLGTLCSTKTGKHGSVRAGTEVPRGALVEELEKNSAFATTESYSNEIHRDFEIRL